MKPSAPAYVAICMCTTACSSILGDFATGPGPADSGSSNPSSRDASMTSVPDGASVVDSGNDSATNAVTVSAAGLTEYVGQTATLTATSSTTPDGGTVTYSWALAGAPPLSTIASSSLSGADTATVSFVPDVAGDYSLALTATSGGASATTTLTVRAIAPTVLYMLGSLVEEGPDASFTSAYYASASDGTLAHAVTCPVTGSTAAPGGLFSVAPQIDQFFPSDDFTDFWEAPAGQASRFAVSVYNVDPTGNPMLFSGLEDASCASPPTEIRYDGGSVQPRFTADGSRLAFIGLADLNVVTVNPDGTDMRVVCAYSAGLVDSGLTYDTDPLDVQVPPRPQWVGSRIAWVRQYTPDSDPAWEIVEADDVAGATPQRYMACPGGTPREFQFLADGTVIVAYRTTASTGPENLYRLTPDSSENCTIVDQYTDLGNSTASQATDFAVSPDETRIAYVQYDGVTDDAGYASGLPGGYGYVVDVDGGTPVRLSNDFLMYGPRWIGDGTRLVAARYDGLTDGGIVPVATSIIVRAPSPGPAVPLLSADGYTTFASTGSNGGCNTAPGAVSPLAALVGLIGAAFGFVGRKLSRR